MLLSPNDLEVELRRHRGRGHSIAFTNGCFDVFHAGHVHLLEQAAGLADVLIVGLNADASIRALKGASRPRNPFDDRARVLLATWMVDYVIGFSDLTPATLIERIRPDVLVKGSDWADREIAGAEFAGEVRLIPALPGRSTTAILER
jgi:D-beta-D-heptose 7-phosphate kinase/D-beta-D-heptose 1-phosphate adenosyltransferase